MPDPMPKPVWFPRDSWAFFLLMAPAWGLGGVVWGALMAAVMGGNLIVWQVGGACWAAACYPSFALAMAYLTREVTVRVRLPDPAAAPDAVLAALVRPRYVLEEVGPGYWVGTPRHPVGRRFEFNRVHVVAHAEGVALTGPSGVVNRVRKALTRPGH